MRWDIRMHYKFPQRNVTGCLWRCVNVCVLALILYACPHSISLSLSLIQFWHIHVISFSLFRTLFSLSLFFFFFDIFLWCRNAHGYLSLLRLLRREIRCVWVICFLWINESFFFLFFLEFESCSFIVRHGKKKEENVRKERIRKEE